MVLKNFSFLSYNSNKSTPSYKTDDSGCEMYPKKKDNTEYYFYDKHNSPIFAKNHEETGERYCRDFLLNEIYPKRPPFFAKNKYNDVFLAKDLELNEYYPTYKGLNVYTFNKNGNVLIAHFNSGRQRYPSDCYGNFYYPVNKEGVPFYLKDENDIQYPAKTKNNIYIYLEPPNRDKKHVRKKKDALNNTVYMLHPKIQNWRISLEVFCALALITSPLVIISALLI